MTSWRDKAHEIIAAECRVSYVQAGNPWPVTRIKRRHKPYAVPQIARDLIDCLNGNDEERAKAIFLQLADGWRFPP